MLLCINEIPHNDKAMGTVVDWNGLGIAQVEVFVNHIEMVLKTMLFLEIKIPFTRKFRNNTSLISL